MSTTKTIKACVDCRHHRLEGFFYRRHMCRRPMGTHVDLVTGKLEAIVNDMRCRHERVTVMFASNCGEEGRFFESPNDVKVIGR